MVMKGAETLTEKQDLTAGRLLLSLMPAKEKFGTHPRYFEVSEDARRGLIRDLLSYKFGQRQEIATEDGLLMRVADHLVALDGEEISVERLEEISEKVADFSEAFFDLDRYCQRKTKDIRQQIKDIIHSAQDRSKETTRNMILYSLLHVGKRAEGMPIAT